MNIGYALGVAAGYLLGSLFTDIPYCWRKYKRPKQVKPEGITDLDYKFLKQQTNHTLAVWACILNSWEWPADLPDPEPIPKIYIPGRRSKIYNWIEEKVGKKYLLMVHNVEMRKDPGRMTKYEFEQWWKEHYEN